MLSKTGRRDRSVWAVVVLVDFLVLALLALAALVYLNPTFGIREESLILPASVLLAVIFAWSLWSWRVVTGSLFDPYALFLIAAALFNGGHAFLEIFDLNKGGILNGVLSSETALETLFLIMLGFTAFHAGGLLSVPSYKKSSPGEGAEEKSTITTAWALRLIGWGLLLVSVVPTFLVLKGRLAVASSSGYFALFQQPVATGLDAGPRVLSAFIVPGALFLLAGSKNSRFNVVLASVVVLGYCFTLFFIGSRQDAVMLLVAYAWVYHRCIRPLPKTLLLGSSGVMLFVVFPLVRFFRDTVTGTNRFSLSALWDTFSSIDNPAVAAISEMGDSMKTVSYTINRVPEYRSFDMGMSYLYSLFDVVPNLFWEIHPTVAQATPDIWLVQTVDPSLANLGNALGFSFIAEAYLNFGWFGAPLALGIMGFLLGKFVLWAERSVDPAKIAAVGAFTGFFLLFARGESHEIFRFLVWYALVPYLGVCALRSLIRPGSIGRRPSSSSKGFDGLVKGKGVA